MVSRMRFELMTLWLKVKCSTCWANGTWYGCLGKIRTCACHSQSVVPYRLATRQFFNTTFKKVVEGNGFEPLNPKEQIYSLPRLATSLPFQKKDGAENRNWTRNLLITSQLLYQLSYFGTINGGRYRTRTYDPLLVRQVL